MTAALMGIDLGAGSLKVTIIGSDGRTLGSASSVVETASPYPGWAEQDPEEWYQGLCAAAPVALIKAGVLASDIRAVSFSAGAHTPVLLDEDDKVIRSAILWSDQRSIEESKELTTQSGAMIQETGFNAPNPTWTLPQLKWLCRHEPDNVARTRKLLVAKDYLRFRLSGEWHTDRIDAVGTLLTDSKSQAWSSELCDLINWNMALLPPIVDPTEIVGKVSKYAAAQSGLMEGTPVVAGTMDTAIECFGAGAIDPGQGVIKLATAGTVSVVTEFFEPHAEVIDYPHVVSGQAFAITGTNSCASAHRWLRDQFFLNHGASDNAENGSAAFDEMERLAAKIPPGSDGLLFHPYLQGERSPYWDPKLRADFIGITMQHTGAHFVRALYEGIAFSLLDCKGAFDREGLEINSFRLVGGGARSKTWRQIVCDVFGVPIDVPLNGDASFGAALIAGIGVGVFTDERDAVGRCVTLVDQLVPDPQRHMMYQELFSIYKKSQAALAGINHSIFKIMEAHMQ
ncbi:MAG: xylulokinase [Rhodospirillales bacterium]|jgi:xylulokinase|nr:xylulokinase [Rhodospirillales bacterium]